MATDRMTGRRAANEATFVVRPTPRSLLAEAPSLGRPFRRESALSAPALQALASVLSPTATSEGTPDPLTRAVDALAAGRFADLVQVASSAPGDQGRALMLRAAGLFGLGESPRVVLALLQQAGTGQLGDGRRTLFDRRSARATAGDERGAVDAWLASRDAGMPDRVVAPLLVIDGYLRLGDLARPRRWRGWCSTRRLAIRVGGAGPGGDPARREPSARGAGHVEASSGAAQGDDGEFLALHALFGSFVAGEWPGGRAPNASQVFAAAEAYIGAARLHADLRQQQDRQRVGAPPTAGVVLTS
ncbi:MAG: hypothetical protein U0802_09625 [Candidatus Binatia bacterium]